MKYIKFNNCPARQLDLHYKRFCCFVTGNECLYDTKESCKDYQTYVPKPLQRGDSDETERDISSVVSEEQATWNRSRS